MTSDWCADGRGRWVRTFPGVGMFEVREHKEQSGRLLWSLHVPGGGPGWYAMYHTLSQALRRAEILAACPKHDVADAARGVFELQASAPPTRESFLVPVVKEYLEAVDEECATNCSARGHDHEAQFQRSRAARNALDTALERAVFVGKHAEGPVPTRDQLVSRLYIAEADLNMLRMKVRRLERCYDDGPAKTYAVAIDLFREANKGGKTC